MLFRSVVENEEEEEDIFKTIGRRKKKKSEKHVLARVFSLVSIRKQIAFIDKIYYDFTFLSLALCVCSSKNTP